MKASKCYELILLSFLLFTAKAFSEEPPPVVQLVKNNVEQSKILSSPECVEYVYVPGFSPGIDLVDVVERHDHGCPGDPQTEPRLFSVYVDQKTHKMESDFIDKPDGSLSVFPPG